MGRHSDQDGDGIADQADPDFVPDPISGVSPSLDPRPGPDELAAAVAATGYTYTDPVEDPAHPRIGPPLDEAPDAFPEGWSAEPTERDQAAIDSGAAAQAAVIGGLDS